ncbi:hypothetical protein, partial [Streptomyces sp. PH10-H1]
DHDRCHDGTGEPVRGPFCGPVHQRGGPRDGQLTYPARPEPGRALTGAAGLVRVVAVFDR